METKIKCLVNLLVLFGFIQIINCQIVFPSDDYDDNKDTNVRVDVENTPCNTPSRRSGTCVNIRTCRNLWQLIEKQASFQLTYPELLYLRNSQCGEANGNILVCCEKSEVTASSTPTTKKPVARPTQTHRNKNLLPTTSQCASTSDRIYGGTETELGEFPWMALIEYTKRADANGHHCGGSLINNRYVLTAAHCIKKIPRDWREYAVRLGEHDTTTSPDCVSDINNNEECAPPHIDIPIEKTIVHQDYNPTSKGQYNDIALLRLSRPVQYSAYIKPVCLPTTSELADRNLTGIGLAVAGWGRTESGYASTVKLKAIVKAVSLPSCNNVYSAQRVSLEDTQLCAGGQKGIDSCNGDSGGPLIGMDTTKIPNYFYLTGVVSFGPRSCGSAGWPGVYTKVAPYVEWIMDNLEP